MEFLRPSGIWALTALIPVILLWILKKRAKRETVPSLLLWKRMESETPQSRPFQKLRSRLLLWLQILMVLLLTFALMRPATTGGTQRGTRQGRQVEAVDDDVALGGLLQGRQTADKRGLTGARAADDPVDRTAINVQVHPIERDDRAAVFHGVDLRHPGEVNHVHLRYWAARPATSAYEGHARERSECCYKTPYRG